MKIQLQIILMIGVLILLRISTQAQITHLVTNTNNSGTGSLRQAVIDASANDIVRLSPSLLANGTDSIVLTSEIAFSKPLVFKGVYNGTDTLYISGNKTNRIFNVSNTGNLTLDSMVLMNGNVTNGNGGAISFVDSDTIFIVNSTIRNNFSSKKGGGIFSKSSFYSDFYSASRSASSNIIATNSLISENFANKGGGGICSVSYSNYNVYSRCYSASNVTVINSIINNNGSDSGNGGGIYSYSYSSSQYSSDSYSKVTINNSSVNSNSGGNGGGIYSYSSLDYRSAALEDRCSSYSKININNSTINSNFSRGSGGGIYCNEDESGSAHSSITITSSSVNDNSSNSNGGGICFDSPSSPTIALPSLVKITNSTINNNSSNTGRGGGLFFSSHYKIKTIIDNSTISNNSAQSGGGIYSYSYYSRSWSKVLVNNSTINNNSVTQKGGGIYSASFTSYVFITKSTLSNNTANKGGGVFSLTYAYRHSTVKVITSTISNNSAIVDGAGIYSYTAYKLHSIIEIAGSIVWSSTSTGSNIYDNGGSSRVISLGYNIFSDTPIGATTTGDLTNVTSSALNLQPISNNGGGTLTMLPGIGSVALNAGSPNDFTDAQNKSILGIREIGSTESNCNEYKEEVQIACDSYTWRNGVTYITTNQVTDTILNAASIGCDSIYSLDLTIIDSSSGIDTRVACDSFTWIDGITYTASNNSATYILVNAPGCDSVESIFLDLTIEESSIGIDTLIACDSLIWIDGYTYTTSNNTATYTFSNTTGCDSLVKLNLTINYPNTGTDNQTVCNTFTWIDGNTYTANNNTATHTLTNSVGCDSVVTLNLIIINSNTGIDNQIVCDSLTWIDGNTYTSNNNTATHTLTNSVGCDSVVTLNLTIVNSSTGTDVQTACDTLIWIDGNTYTTNNNTATYTLTNSIGCDSVVTLNLTLNSNTGIDTQTACDTFTWIDGNTYTSNNNTATDTLINIFGCDSVVTLNLTINSNTGIDNQTACDSFTWIDGNTYTSNNNTATHALTNVFGCDSVITLNLIMNHSSYGIDTLVSCDSILWIDGNTYTSSNNSATHTLINSKGCDSTVTLNLIINHSSSSTDTLVSCDSILWIDGNTYTSSNNSAMHTLLTSQGCDSIVTLNLTINHSNYIMDSIVSCSSIVWIDGNTYDTSNYTASISLINSYGCDSIISLNLTILPPISGDSSSDAIAISSLPYSTTANTSYCYTNSIENSSADIWYSYVMPSCIDSLIISLCGSSFDTYLRIFESDGVTELFYNDDNYLNNCVYQGPNNLTSYLGIDISSSAISPGDSIYIVVEGYRGLEGEFLLNISSTPLVKTSTDTQIACSSYTWIDGNTYTSDNDTSTYLLTSLQGCDSLITLDLTMSDTLFGVDFISAYDSIIWIDGNTYSFCNNTANYTLTSVQGCDSIVTLNLTILNPGTDVITACDSIVWMDGITYLSNNNTAIHTFSNATGCDSSVVLDLTILNSSSYLDSKEACLSYTWLDGVTYTSSNNSATYILTNAIGCDSVITLDLTLNEVNTSISILNGALYSNEIDGAYQWLYCDSNYASIPLAINQSYVPVSNGYYSVEIISTEGCIDTTPCIYVGFADLVSINNYSLNELKAYPNPTNGNITLELNEDYSTASLFITDITGKVVYSLEIKNKMKVNLATELLSKGVYIIKLETKNKSKSIQLIKQ